MRIYLFFLPLAAMLLSCGTAGESGKPMLAVTMEPYRFIVEAVAGDKWQVVSMVPKGSSPETFDPSPGRMTTLGRCRAYFMTGGIGFEQSWGAKIAEMFPSLPMIDTSEGIERIHDDPHLWTSPDNMSLIARNVCNALCRLDSTDIDGYVSRLSDAEAMLCAVDSTIRARLATGADSCFVVFHPSLTYFARLYGLRQMVLEEHGKEPSASHIKHTIDEARRLGVGKIFIQAEFDKKHAESIARELNAAIITIDPLSYNWCGEMLNIVDQLKNGKE